MFSRGKDRNPNALGIFLNAAGKDQPFGWQRRGVKFSLCVVNRLDFSKSIVKGELGTSIETFCCTMKISHQLQADVCKIHRLQLGPLCTRSEAGSR